MGPESFKQFVSWDRPYSAWIYSITYLLFGENVLPYQILIFAERWLSGVLFWLVFRKVWPKAERLVMIAALLFLVYPGFQQQPIAVQYILHFATLDLILFSLFSMLRGFESSATGYKSGMIFWMIVTFLSAAAGLFSCEYFVGLEAIRPLILVLYLKNREFQTETPAKEKVPFGRFLLHWLPGLAAFGAFMYWRVFIFSFQTYGPKFFDKFAENKTSALLLLIRKVLNDLNTVILKAWRRTLTHPSGGQDLLFWALIALAAFFCVLLLLKHSENGENGRGWAAPQNQMFWLGLAALLTAGAPYWATLLNVEMSYPWDRTSISFSAGAAFLVAALLEILLRSRWQVPAAALLTAMAAASHYSNAIIYRWETQKMNDYFWQLAWRAPALEKGTIIASDEIPLNRYSDNDLAPILNWQYNPGLRGNRYQYEYFDLDLREGIFYSDLSSVQPVDHTYRSHQFQSFTNKTLTIYYKENQCLWVIGKDDQNYPGLPESIVHVSAVSDENLISSNTKTAVTPPKAIGSQPEHGYCYYFQRTALALQEKDAKTAHAQASAALDAGLKPNALVDWIPLAKAFLQSGDQPHLDQIAKAINGDLNLQQEKFFCEEISGSVPADGSGDSFLEKIGCR